MIKKFSQTIYRIARSSKFFYVIIGLFVLEAAWFAITAQYPMAFDEQYHFGIIQIYSHQWLPFITTNPPNSAQYGDITRYDSYMYHYLMSFPYRLIALFVHQQIAQIIILRFINIGMFVGGIVLFRRLLRRVHVSDGLANFSFLIFILVPVVPFLAATINYDNLTFLLVPIVAGLAITCANALRNKQQIPARSFILLLIVGGLSSLVKYAFLPIFVAALLYLVVLYVRMPKKKKILGTFVTSFKGLSHAIQGLLIVGIIISGGLFIERYGINIVQYHSVEPDCSQIQSLSSCLQYGPWARNYNDAQKVINDNVAIDPPVAFYVPVWLGGMMDRLYFAINYTFANYPPLPIPIYMAAFIGSLGFILVIVYRRSIMKIDRNLLLLGLIILLYIGGLFYVNVTEYLKYRSPVAINGRYLIIVMPLIFALVGLAYREFFKTLVKKHTDYFIAVFSVVILILALQGGGMLTDLVQSNSSWYWNNSFISKSNAIARDIVSPFIIGSRNR